MLSGGVKSGFWSSVAYGNGTKNQIIRLLTFWFSTDYSDYGAAIVSELSPMLFPWYAI